MYEIIGKYNTATVYASVVNNESHSQVLAMCNMKELENCKICMMPDMHAAEGCTVGTAMTFLDKLNPSFVGSDIGCGMQVYKLEKCGIDYAVLDDAIRSLVPSGARIHKIASSSINEVPLDSLYCRDELQYDIVSRSFGTLGGGNHFIELDKGMDDSYYLVIHSGSRRLGKDVSNYHQTMAFFAENGISPDEAKRKKMAVGDVKGNVRYGECFLTGEYLDRYLHDMEIAMRYAELSRKEIAKTIFDAVNLNYVDSFVTVHNYVDNTRKVLRKGAVSSEEGEKLIIPINMRDGCLVCEGKGNPDWNFSAPHGSGRTKKRSESKSTITLEEFREAMKGIYSTSIDESTVDESPMAYRGIDEIIDNIEPTAKITDIITPLYNFKASKLDKDPETEDGND